MQLFQINQSEDSSKITIKFNNTCDQLHQRSVTSAINYNRTYSITEDTYRGLSENISLDSVGEGKVTNNSQKCRVMCRYRKHSVVINIVKEAKCQIKIKVDNVIFFRIPFKYWRYVM